MLTMTVASPMPAGVSRVRSRKPWGGSNAKPSADIGCSLRSALSVAHLPPGSSPGGAAQGALVRDRRAHVQRAHARLPAKPPAGAPHVAIITTDALLGTYGAVDCGAYVQNFMLAARSLGIASIAQAALAMRSKFLRHWFDIPSDRQIVCGISFGYEDGTHPANAFRTTRAPLEAVLQWVDR